MSYHFPRVLVVAISKVQADDPANMLPRVLFEDWRREDVAQIYSGDPGGHGNYFDNYYQVQSKDRWFGSLFLKLKPSAISLTGKKGISEGKARKSLLRVIISPLRRLSNFLVIDSGFWELIFRIRISKEMGHFIREFKPDIIYCQGYTYSFALLPRLIAKKFNIPICFHTTDDWPVCLYRHSPMHFIVMSCARRLIKESDLRLAFGTKMLKEFTNRYKTEFKITWHADDWNRFRVSPVKSHQDGKPVILFTGSIFSRRHETLVDLLLAARKVREIIGEVHIDVRCTGVPADLPDILREAEEVNFYPLPSHDELPAVLVGTSIFFISESFNSRWYNNSLSISSKCHLAMMSQVPTIVYAPPWNGSVDYAFRGKWGYAITNRDVKALSEALIALLTDADLVDELKSNSETIARQNHDKEVLKIKFAEYIREAVAGKKHE